MNSRSILAAIPLFAAVLSAQTPSAKQQEKQLPSFMRPCSNLTCEIENDWSRNNVLIYGLANAMPEDKYTYKSTPAQRAPVA